MNSREFEERVLIIDDDTELCELVTEYLETEGFGVEVIHDGTDAVERAVSGSYRLIILDARRSTTSTAMKPPFCSATT